ncbi:hypothetical protein OBBRIDRAFT_772640 [Obba rivulosa]|uniref:Uncharacterized protein n=1 Tax=Obba rivulosa TaxID=1052685 RepID=A0A8E2DLV4_9APHY|nr:hypothetical protein OBBRIDRAFT_772640 [Obba rivulosa]
MEYTPRYPQPFTLQEAVQLDVSVITEEIARLQNSLEHLKKTQQGLREALEASADPEFADAIGENEDVIGSQEERISILKMALAEKGIVIGSHYDIQTTNASQRVSGPQSGERATRMDGAGANSHVDHASQEQDSSASADGVYL